MARTTIGNARSRRSEIVHTADEIRGFRGITPARVMDERSAGDATFEGGDSY
jgi:hypothetical protein